MADFLSGFGIPDIDGNDPAEALNKIRDYLYQLQEQLRYMTNNLGVGNFNDAELDKLAMTIRMPLTMENDASDEEITRYIRFVDGDIILGESGNELTLTIQNDQIFFSQNGIKVAYFSNDRLYVMDGDFISTLKIGNFAFVPRVNGNLSIKKVW